MTMLVSQLLASADAAAIARGALGASMAEARKRIEAAQAELNDLEQRSAALDAEVEKSLGDLEAAGLPRATAEKLIQERLESLTELGLIVAGAPVIEPNARKPRKAAKAVEETSPIPPARVVVPPDPAAAPGATATEPLPALEPHATTPTVVEPAATVPETEVVPIVEHPSAVEALAEEIAPPVEPVADNAQSSAAPDGAVLDGDEGEPAVEVTDADVDIPEWLMGDGGNGEVVVWEDGEPALEAEAYAQPEMAAESPLEQEPEVLSPAATIESAAAAAPATSQESRINRPAPVAQPAAEIAAAPVVDDGGLPDFLTGG